MYRFQKFCVLFILTSISAGLNAINAQEEISKREHKQRILSLTRAHKIFFQKSFGASLAAGDHTEIIVPIKYNGKEAFYFYANGRAYLQKLTNGEKSDFGYTNYKLRTTIKHAKNFSSLTYRVRLDDAYVTANHYKAGDSRDYLPISETAVVDQESLRMLESEISKRVESIGEAYLERTQGYSHMYRKANMQQRIQVYKHLFQDTLKMINELKALDIKVIEEALEAQTKRVNTLFKAMMILEVAQQKQSKEEAYKPLIDPSFDAKLREIDTSTNYKLRIFEGGGAESTHPDSANNPLARKNQNTKKLRNE
jgi:hypothetical protein